MGLIATQNDLLRQLFQGQQTIPQLLQQQQHQLSGYPIHQPQIANYQEPNEETKEEKDIYLDSLLPPSQLLMKLEEMKARNPKYSLDPIDLIGWEITCTEFIPCRRHQHVKTSNSDIVFRARTLLSIKEKMDQEGNFTYENDSLGMPIMLPLENNQPRGTSDINRCINYATSKQKIECKRQRKEHKSQQQGATKLSVPQQQQQQQFGPRPNDQQFNHGNNYNRCFNCGSTSHFARNCPQPKKSFSSQNFNQNNQGKGKKQVMQVRQGKINFTTLAEFPEDASTMMGTFSIPHESAVTLLDSGVTCSFDNIRF